MTASTANLPAVPATCDFYSAATDLLGRGFSIIPLQPTSKLPVKGIGPLSRTKDPVVIQAWAERYPDSNVAIVADENIVILESDDLPRFTELIKGTTNKDLPVTLTACGSSPDRPHFFFKRTEKAANVGCLGIPGLFEDSPISMWSVPAAFIRMAASTDS